jgi:Polyketide cyclase / dehydrase and lipid transport
MKPWPIRFNSARRWNPAERKRCGSRSGVQQGSIRIAANAHSQARPSAVFALLKDGETWPRWTIFTGFELERPGATEPLGVGNIHVFSTALTRAREETVELVADKRLSYVLLSGFPFLNYRADVDLAPVDGGGTSISWCASFDTKYPGTGWFWRLFMTAVLRKIAADLAAAAEKTLPT